MGYKRLSEQELSDNISFSDEIIAIISNSLKKISINTLVNLLNTNFDVVVAKNTEDEYKLSVTVGSKTITTPNLRTVSITDANLIAGDLIIRFSDGTEKNLGNVLRNVPQYGVCINHATASPTLERCGDAVGLKAEVATGNNTPINDFDYVYPYSKMRKCTLADDGTVTAYKGDANYIEDGSIGQVMVEIPKFYIRRFVDEVNQKEYIYICEQQLEGYVLPECFKDRDGNELDHVYIASYLAYEDDDEEAPKAWSIAGKELSDLPSHKHADYYETIGNRAGHNEDEESEELYLTPWHNLDVHEMCMLQMLFMVEFATTDSEGVFGGMYDDYGTAARAIDETSVSQSTNTLTSVESLSEGDNIKQGDLVEISCAEDYDIIPEEGAYRDEYEDEGVEHFWWTVKRRVVSVVDTEDTRAITFDGVPVALDAESTIQKIGYLTGCTNEMDASSGNLTSDEDELHNIPFVWRGLENFFSCVYTWVSGVFVSKNADGGTYRVTSNLNLYGDLSAVLDYADTEIQPPSTDFIRGMTFDTANPLLMLPAEGGGTELDGYCDKFNLNTLATTVKAYRFGGASVSQGGLFAASASASTARCRLAYHHY